MRGRRFATEADIKRHISKGLGSGAGASYQPWLRVQDVPSHGHSRKVHGVKIDRIHHLLSNLEYASFLVSEFSEDVVDIREQFPLLPSANVQTIANTLCIRYPNYPKSSLPLVMTTDLLLTVREPGGTHRSVAYSVKYTKDLNDIRTVEKLEIEKEFWNAQGVDWSIVTEEQFTIDEVNNISMLRKFALAPTALTKPDLVEEFLDRLEQCEGYGWTTAEALRKIASKTHITYKDAKHLYLHLIWSKRIKIDLLSVPIQAKLLLPELEVIRATPAPIITFQGVI